MIGATCPCGLRFQVAESLQGGLANCPACHKAVPIKGGPEPLFWILFAAGGAGVLGLAALVSWQFGWIPGAVVLGAGVIVLGLVVLMS